jgi:hypothetical protein
MLLLGKMLAMAMALIGGLLFSQAPEFAQQYRQRIGGALDELRAIITQFDNEASRNGLDRQTALGLYTTSAEQFLRAQGDAMRYSFTRYQTLEQQSRDLDQAPPMAKPFVILRNPDPDLTTNAWRDFAPGIPVTMAGLVWAGVGLILGWLAAALFGAASLRAARRRRHVKEAPRDKVVGEELPRHNVSSRGTAYQELQRADLPWRSSTRQEASSLESPHQTVNRLNQT